jgi:hypothetical protein
MFKIMKKILFLAYFIFFCVSYTQAQCNLSYVGPTNGDWHTPGNWNLCKVPDANDIVTIPAGKSVMINNTNATCRNITVVSGGTVTRNGTGVLTVTNSVGSVPCTAACFKRVFVTSTQQNGNLGGLTGADGICQTRANAASLGGTWRAWLSTPSVNANTRITNAEYRRIDGITVIATSLADLTDGTLNASIQVTEMGVTLTGPNDVFTGTLSNGTLSPDSGGYNYHCTSWTSNQFAGGVAAHRGSPSSVNSWWTLVTPGLIYCNANARLYCFEQ